MTINDDIKNKPANMGRMNDPDGAASITGLCRDTMEMYLIINDNKISDAWFYTDGCGSSISAGSLTAGLSKGKEIKDALRISPADIIDKMQEHPGFEKHCAILAVMTLHKAIADYILRLERT
ncbi:MAG: iron-sulfur cluster assembly scaffold protein [Spirochaetes bacterium]|nr:iron-sulfur cluster assembly scaffold protein [Spirochaetota bacterium]